MVPFAWFFKNEQTDAACDRFFQCFKNVVPLAHRFIGFAKISKRHKSGDPFFGHSKKGLPLTHRLLIF